MIKQVFAPYTEWEDWKNGMYRDVCKEEHCELVRNATEVLTNADLLIVEMRRAVSEWPISAAVNLTDQTKNHRPWLGQAACCISRGCTEVSVREAWNSIGAECQRLANLQADIVFEEFRLVVNTSKQLTFGF